MRALTLHRHWAAAVLHLGKRVENRSRPTPRNLRDDEWIAIHAGLSGGRHADVAALGELVGRDVSAEVAATPAGAVVAVCRVPRWCGTLPNGAFRRWAWDGGRAFEVDWLPAPVNQYRWFTGPYGWELTDVQVLPEPVPARGALGLWRLPDDVERAVRAQMEAIQ